MHHLHHSFLIMMISLLVTIHPAAQHVPTSPFCGKIQLGTPFLKRIILCKSQKPYLRSSLGLFPISSIDYTTKTLTISHSSASSKDYVSPKLITAGFPPTPHPNSLLLFNCSNNIRNHMPPFLRNCSGFQLHHENSSTASPGHDSCLLVDDVVKLDKGFHPKDWNCSHYKAVHRRCLEDKELFEIGTRVSIDIPDHVPDICKECKQPNGSCGAGLRCICHAKECKDKVVSLSGYSLNPICNIFFSLLSFIVLMLF